MNVRCTWSAPERIRTRVLHGRGAELDELVRAVRPSHVLFIHVWAKRSRRAKPTECPVAVQDAGGGGATDAQVHTGRYKYHLTAQMYRLTV